MSRRYDMGVWLLAVDCTVFGALDFTEVAFILRLHANIRTRFAVSSQ